MNKRDILSNFVIVDENFVTHQCKTYASALKSCRTVKGYYERICFAKGEPGDYFVKSMLSAYSSEIRLMKMKIKEDHCE